MTQPYTTASWITDGKNTGLLIKTYYKTFFESRLIISDNNDYIQQIIETIDIYNEETTEVTRDFFNNLINELGIEL